MGKQYTIEGTIINQDNQPIGGLLVRATDQDFNTPENVLGTPVYTDEKGQYKINYKDEDFRLTRKEKGGADIIIRVFSREGRLLGKSKRYNNSPQHITIDVKVDYTQAQTPDIEYTVSGSVTLPDGQAASHFFVQAFDKDLRSEEWLGDGITDKQGHYSIWYSSRSILHAERGSADIFIKVFDPRNRPAGESEIIFNASSRAIIDYQIKDTDVPRLTEFELIRLALLPLLNGVPVTDLDESDILILNISPLLSMNSQKKRVR